MLPVPSGSSSGLDWMRIGISQLPIEWWYNHLADSLRLFNEVQAIVPAFRAKPGYALETDLNVLREEGKLDFEAYVGSASALFRGIAELPVPTATWSDFIPGCQEGLAALRLFDVVFASQRDSVELLRAAGLKHVEWMPFGFDDSLGNHPDLPKEFDVAFIGSLREPATAERRKAVLDAIEPICRMNDFRRPCFGPDVVNTYNRARMVVNVPVPGGFNMRTFEAMGAGAMLLTEDVGNGQNELFKEGEHLVVYRSISDLVEKVKFYMSHEEERAWIARNGMECVLKFHTYRHRAHAVADLLASGPARCRSMEPADWIAAYTNYYRWARRLDLMLRTIARANLPWKQRVDGLAKAVRCAAGLWKRGWE